MRLTRAALLLVCGLVFSCGTETPPTEVAVGTWGGADAGFLVAAEGVHAHIGCTLGDAPGRIPLDPEGHFDVPGTYNVDAYPVDQGIIHPARFSGVTDGETLTFSVRLTDTDRVLGPAVVTFGREPKMQNCPICSLATAQSRLAATPSPGASDACAATGEITFLDVPGRRLGVKDAAGRMHTYSVDEKLTPGWAKQRTVGEQVDVTCRDMGEERRPLATKITPAGRRAAP